jgi:endoglucanase
MKYLKDLCILNGVSGSEDAVRDYIVSHIHGCEYSIDNLGNVIVNKKGAKKPKNKLMFFAHMDEVGFIITYIDESGMLKCDTIGGIDPKAILGKPIKINSGVNGVVGTAPIHLCDADEVEKMPAVSDMFIDIGAKNKSEAEKYVSTGDNACFISEYETFGDGFIKSKAIDDRFGCAVLLELLEEELPYDISVCFSVMEEIGLVGAGRAAYSQRPDIGVVVESTTANDVCGVSGNDKVCALGSGAVVSFMDSKTIYDKKLYDEIMKTAADNSIKAQTKTKIAGGNDAYTVQRASDGVRVAAVSLPTRYIHSSSCVACERDMESVKKLVFKIAETFGETDNG